MLLCGQVGFEGIPDKPILIKLFGVSAFSLHRLNIFVSGGVEPIIEVLEDFLRTVQVLHDRISQSVVHKYIF